MDHEHWSHTTDVSVEASKALGALEARPGQSRQSIGSSLQHRALCSAQHDEREYEEEREGGGEVKER